MEATFTPGVVLLLAGVGFLSLIIFFLLLLLCQRALKSKHGYRLPSLQVRHREAFLRYLALDWPSSGAEQSSGPHQRVIYTSEFEWRFDSRPRGPCHGAELRAE